MYILVINITSLNRNTENPKMGFNNTRGSGWGRINQWLELFKMKTGKLSAQAHYEN